MRGIHGAVLALALMGVPAGANASDFTACDGYGPPTRKVDGMTSGTFLWGLATATEDIRRGTIQLGAPQLAACDRALADPMLLESYWLRRANLLQAKSLHALSLKQYDVALELLGQSDALGAKDALFGGSLGLANRAIRAFTLTESGRKEAALAEIALIERARPWSASTRRLTFLLRMQLDDGEFMPVMRANMPLMPENAMGLFWNALSNGDYALALDYAPGISFDLPKMRGGWQIEDSAPAELKAIELRAEVAGAWAFALAITGQGDAAIAKFVEAEQQLADAAARPSDRPNGQPPRKRDLEAWSGRLPYVQTGRGSLERWRAARDVVLAAGSRSALDDLDRFNASGASRLPVLPAMLSRLKLAGPEEAVQRDQLLAGYRQSLLDERRKILAFTVAELIPMLPRHQTEKMIPVLKPAGDGYFLSDTGLSRAREGDSDIWTLRFVHKFAPIQVVEEMAMLGAAVTALREGKDGFVILSRRSAILTTHLINYSTRTEMNSGYEAQVRVMFINRAALPPEFARMGWRVIPAQDVVDQLSNRYRKSDGITVAW